ncbi:hypothetical protein [Clostridium perfringens]|uniref:hypothetical protein n=1 Tax=Clostridium perfringens TaxID=1502 RepID=UPI0007767D2A|nr:hypothetical protein [Clostridium perfringens]PWX46955.1 hypothetical protein CYK61_14070 [Clostridium perfringens]HAT4117250.1 hypothetical protein [Clostridium perfringens]HAT4216024.1 hypothetical protein [Clostridium perfringens]
MLSNISKKQLGIYLKMIKIEANEIKEKFEIIDMNKDDLEFGEWVNDPEYLKFNTEENLKRIKKINRYIDYVYERI